MKPLSLSKVNCRFGAPMGRSNQLPINKNSEGKLQIRRLKLFDGCYDEGGAYWGTPANLYHAEGDLRNEDETAIIFVRANSRKDAKDKIRETLPNVSFYR